MRSNLGSGFRQLWNNGILIPVIYCIVMTVVASRHLLFVDWDGSMHYFSSVEIYAGQGYHGWASHFWPPLFPLLAGLLNNITDGFSAGKMVSVVSSSLLLYVVYRFVYYLSGNRTAAWVAQLLLITNFLYELLSIQAEDHMLDSLFYISAMLLLLKALEKGTEKAANRYYFLVGILCGMAGLSRYTSYSMIPGIVITLLLFYPLRATLKFTLLVGLGFTLVSLPWWIINTMNNGGPFNTWQYMNVGAGVFAASKYQWWWANMNHFDSVPDIMRHAPVAYVKNFFHNIYMSIALTVYNGQFTCAISLAAMCVLTYKRYVKGNSVLLRNKKVLPLLVCFVFYLGLVSQAFVFKEVFLSWVVLIIIYGVWAMYELNVGRELLSKQTGRRMNWIIRSMVVLILVDIASTTRQMIGYMNSEGGIEENKAIMAAIRRQDPDLKDKVVMSYHPGRAYHLGSRFIMLPLYYKGDINGLVTYQDLTAKVRGYAPRFPSNLNTDQLKTDYLVYDDRATAYLPQFSFLLQKDSKYIPANFHLVYYSAKVAVYRID